ncbi:MAG: biotin synthase BioB [Thermodesulfobacteriota bacterium]|nr:biotin synthase BioB [Thermodesulfobacteriota bacterium]
MIGFLDDLTKKVLDQEHIDFEEAEMLLSLDTQHNVMFLAAAANLIRYIYRGDEVDLCALLNAKSGKCSEDCAFCAQSGHWKTEASIYPLVDEERMVEAAREAKKIGADRFCIITSGKKVQEDEFEVITKALTRINREVGISLDCSLGSIPEQWMATLREAGVTRYNHNLETSQEHFPNICTTHTFEERWNTAKTVSQMGMERCCGGIIGMGETEIDRLNLAFSLRDLSAECVTINILNPRPGTPLENLPPLHPIEIIKTIAIFRFILPSATIKIAGGRELNLRDIQALALSSGANGLIVGGYLTTSGRNFHDDIQMIKDLGLITKGEVVYG